MVIIIPITLWTFIVCFGKGGMPRCVCWWNIGIGLFHHIVMFDSIMPQVFSGNINMPLLTVIGDSVSFFHKTAFFRSLLLLAK